MKRERLMEAEHPAERVGTLSSKEAKELKMRRTRISEELP